MPNILIADDHTIVRYGTALIIKDLIAGVYVAEAGTFAQTLKILDSKTFDLLILDINIPGGNNLQMLDVIRLHQPQIRILIFSGYDEQLFALRYMQAGADGYVVKHSGEQELRTAIRGVLNNEKYISPTVKQHLLNSLSSKSGNGSGNPLQLLSNREMEVMQLLIKGSSVADIGVHLSLQISTVSTYKSRIFEKLEVANVIELAEKVRLFS
ncbi:MAG: response regulator transcription factor [Candidatus Pseudobacter hemicellulosilyticus]|uniref:Response regulator transcription factor n=1 Tax=Candidatus Pseudobacter hemicellulosilyticus TaxID=3121375 RepID=A0AAJ5WP08_9BACT|nr:MAG: response regulator transcription factor [Pseudobacter sp.]